MPIQGLNPDPVTDPNDPNYDPALDPNSDQYEEPPADQPDVTDPLGATPPEPEAKALTKETLWQLYAVQAINSLYPNLRNGVDFAWGRAADDPTGEPKILGKAEGITIDEGKVRAAAQKIADADPYSFYEPEKPLHTGTVKEPTTQSDLGQQDVQNAQAASDLPDPEYGTPQ